MRHDNIVIGSIDKYTVLTKNVDLFNFESRVKMRAQVMALPAHLAKANAKCTGISLARS